MTMLDATSIHNNRQRYQVLLDEHCRNATRTVHRGSSVTLLGRWIACVMRQSGMTRMPAKPACLLSAGMRACV